MESQHVMTTESRVPMGPWGQQGTMLKEAPTSLDAMVQANLDWPVVTKPAGYINSFGDFIEFPDKKMVVRETDGKVLSVVGNVWRPIQNRDAFTFFDPMVEAGLCEYNVAGYVNDGEKIFVVCKIIADPMEVLPGDTMDSYLVLTNLHSAAAAGRIIFTNIRFICTNVLPAMMRSENQTRMFHQGDILKNMKQVQEIIDMRQHQFSATLQQFRRLAEVQLNSARLEIYLDEVLENNKIKVVNGELDETVDDKLYKNTKATIIELFEHGKGTEINGVRGTYWGAYNSVTEWLDYHKGHNENNRLNSVLYGESKKRAQKALYVALEHAA